MWADCRAVLGTAAYTLERRRKSARAARAEGAPGAARARAAALWDESVAARLLAHDDGVLVNLDQLGRCPRVAQEDALEDTFSLRGPRAEQRLVDRHGQEARREGNLSTKKLAARRSHQNQSSCLQQRLFLAAPTLGCTHHANSKKPPKKWFRDGPRLWRGPSWRGASRPRRTRPWTTSRSRWSGARSARHEA